MKKRIERFSPYLLWGCFAAWLGLTLLSTLYHEPWIDEIYAWQISKFSIRDIFYEMRYEGHFALWYLILAPFSHLGLPLKALNIVAWAINGVTGWYFLKKAPFSVWAKLLLLLSVPFLYTNPVISRCYVLIPLLLFLLAEPFIQTQKPEVWKEKKDGYLACGILLALLANTHVYVEGFAGIIGLILLIQTIRDWKYLSSRQRGKRIGAFAIALVGALVALLQVFPSFLYSSVFTDGQQHGSSPLAFLYGSGLNGKPLMLLSMLVLMFIGIYLLCRNLLSVIIVLVSNLSMVAMCMLVYGGSIPNRAVMWLYFVLFCLWITETMPKASRFFKVPSVKWEKVAASIFVGILAIMLFQPTKTISDFKNLYSGESRFAYYIEDNLPADVEIYSNPGTWCCAIMEYLPEYTFYNVKDREILKPRADRIKPTAQDIEQYIIEIFRNTDRDTIYLMDCQMQSEGSAQSLLEQANSKFTYTVQYPQTEDQTDYYLQYFLIEVQRPNV